MNAQGTVLIVDADRGERELICETLGGKGLRFVVTGNMYQAFYQIEHLKVDILIAQLKAERIDGLALLEAAAQHHNRERCIRYRIVVVCAIPSPFE